MVPVHDPALRVVDKLAQREKRGKFCPIISVYRRQRLLLQMTDTTVMVWNDLQQKVTISQRR